MHQTKQPVNAGVLSNMVKFIKTLSDSLIKLIDKLGDWDVKVDKSEETPDGGVYNLFDYEGEKVESWVTPVDGKDGYFNIRVKPKSGKEIKIQNVSKKDVGETLNEALKEAFGVDYSNPKSDTYDDDLNEVVENSRKLKATLQKVESDSGIAIELSAITANYDIVEANKVLSAVLEDDSFVAMISDEPTHFEIIDEEESFDVQQTVMDSDEDIIYQSLSNLIISSFEMIANLKVIHWTAKGKQFDNIHNLSESLMWQLQSQLDYFGELSVTLAGRVINPISSGYSRSLANGVYGFDETTGIQTIKEYIDKYISLLDSVYVNFPKYVQSELDNMISYWTKQSEYFIARKLMAE